jgi:hypothetical protein
LKLIRVITDVPESERLLNASAIIATEWAKTPHKSLKIANSRLIIIPTTLDSVPYFFLTSGSEVFW